jgi:hypothetical protein
LKLTIERWLCTWQTALFLKPQTGCCILAALCQAAVTVDKSPSASVSFGHLVKVVPLGSPPCDCCLTLCNKGDRCYDTKISCYSSNFYTLILVFLLVLARIYYDTCQMVTFLILSLWNSLFIY